MKNYLLAAILLGCLGGDPSDHSRNRVQKVGAGHLEFTVDNTIESTDFGPCSALILDYKNEAVMAHALPGGYILKGKGEIDRDTIVTQNNVVKNCVKELKERGINPGDSEAIVSAGSIKAYQTILEGLAREGIKVRHADYRLKDENTVRNISFNPATDKLNILKRQGKMYETTIP